MVGKTEKRKNMTKVEVEVPQEIIDFLKAVSEFSGEQVTIEEYLDEALLNRLQAQLHNFETEFWSPYDVAVKYGLDKVPGLAEEVKALPGFGVKCDPE